MITFFTKILCCIFLFSWILLGQSFAAIDFYFSPIKYELTVSPWESITRPATLTNNGNETITIVTGKSDFQSNGTSGTPQFVRKSELVFTDQEMSSWITIDTPSFSIGPWEDVTINFTIDVPENASPWGKYAAIFFKNGNSETSTGGNIGINVDYGILILLNVEWEVIIGGEVEEENIIIEWSGTGISGQWGSSWSGQWGGITNNNSGWFWDIFWWGYDDCPLGDFTRSNFDNKCFDNPFVDDNSGSGDSDTWDNEDINDIWSSIVPLGEEEDFWINFGIPFDNTGTVHVKPTGKIVLKDSDGNTLKAIGKKDIFNELGTKVREDIVDYIPINNNEGNVLPKTKRVFDEKWEWFPYQTFDEKWNQTLRYWSPGEYYTKKNQEEAGFLMFWERVCEARRSKTITAFIDVSYTNEKGELIEFSSAKDFDIEYTEQYIGINPYVILPLVILAMIFWFYFLWRFFFLVWKRKRVCPECKTKVRKNWHVCPKCKKKLKK